MKCGLLRSLLPFNDRRYINPRFTYLLPYLLTYSQDRPSLHSQTDRRRPHNKFL